MASIPGESCEAELREYGAPSRSLGPGTRVVDATVVVVPIKKGRELTGCISLQLYLWAAAVA